MIGSTLSHYRIIEELGRGGMGIVYKAEDTKLDRTVAIKVLPASALTSEDDRARFYREAKSAAALNHPHIAQVYEIDEAVPEGGSAEEPRPFIAMEFIDGEPLDVRAGKGPLPLEEAVRLTTQIAQALEVAHEKNIVHRDIKAANVMLTKKGEAKVLDFGLAKTSQSTMLTRMGSTLGTVAYMSPEQARGEDVDGRTDLWALGIVLYQLVSGRLPFGGDYEQAVTYSILNEDPEPLTAVRTGVPMGLEWIVSKLLAKKADDRYQSAKDLIVDLRTVDLTREGLSRTSSLKSMPAAPQAHVKSNPLDLRGRLHPALIVLFIALGALAGWWFSRPAPPPTPLSQQFVITLDDVYNAIYVEVSPDGRYLSFTGQDSTLQGYQVYLYDTVTKDLRVLQDNTGDRYVFSPDGTRLTYRQGRMIYTIPTLGGTPTPVGPFGSGWPLFLPDGSIILDRNERLWVHPDGGPESFQVSRVDSTNGEGGHYNAWAFPDGKHALFHITRTTGEGRQLGLLDLESGEHRILGPGASPRYIGSGHVLYVDGSSSASGQMLIRPFDVDRLEWNGPPAVLAENAGIGQLVVDSRGTMYTTLEQNGTATAGAQRFVQDTFIALSGDSRNEEPFGLAGQFTYHRISPDGNFLAMASDIDQNGLGDYVSVHDRKAGVSQRLNINGDSNYAAWSADGQTLYVELDSNLQIWDVQTMTLRETIEVAGALAEFDVDPQENRIVYVDHSSQEVGNLRVYDLETGTDEILVEGAYGEPRFSRDGRYIAFTDVTWQLLVYSMEDGSIRPVTIEGERSNSPVWGPNGYLYYKSGTSFRRVRVTTDPGFRVLAQAETINESPTMVRFDIADDGTIVGLISTNPLQNSNFERPGPLSIQVTTNWFEVAKRLAPATK